jgi:hypothetical protein
MDKRDNVADETSLVEEGLVIAKRKPELLREGCTKRVVRSWGESEKEDHLAHREDDTPQLRSMPLSLTVSHVT